MQLFFYFSTIVVCWSRTEIWFKMWLHSR